MFEENKISTTKTTFISNVLVSLFNLTSVHYNSIIYLEIMLSLRISNSLHYSSLFFFWIIYLPVVLPLFCLFTVRFSTLKNI